MQSLGELIKKGRINAIRKKRVNYINFTPIGSLGPLQTVHFNTNVRRGQLEEKK